MGARRESPSRFEIAACGLLVLAGAALQAVQLTARDSLDIDQAALASSLVERSWTGLLAQPLDYGQVAPAGFLVLERLAVALFGGGETALRLVPF
ncbi:MAG: hypothetical protein ACRD0X_07485, partial [Thermoanaerobaculia bacterium]